MFQKRHYEWLAAFMAETRPPKWSDAVSRHAHDQWTRTVNDLCEALHHEAITAGTNFKPAMFQATCTRSNEAPIHEFKRAPIISSSTRDV